MSMLLPQFTLRFLLTATAALAAVFLVVSQAFQGKGWALGVSAGFAMLACVLLVHAALFFAVWAFSLLQAKFRRTNPASAFVRRGPTAPEST